VLYLFSPRKETFIMKQDKNYIQHDLTDEELEGVTGGVNAPAAKPTPVITKAATPASKYTPAIQKGLVNEAVALRALAFDLQANNTANAKQDLQMAQDLLAHINQDLK
jgi:hypothetical protein